MPEPGKNPDASAPPPPEDPLQPWCDRFAAAQELGEPPDVEDYVSQAPQELRPQLRQRLTAVRQAGLEAAKQTLSRQRFARLLTKSGLMTAGEVRDFEDSLPPGGRTEDGAELARRLVTAKKLTRFQARAIYRGKTKGLVLGDYVVLDGIGAGGMGLVLKARHQRMDRVVAIKVLPPAAASSPEAVQRFYREVRAAARLVHPNIATAYDAGEHEGTLYLVMEYVDGKDLSQLLKGRGALSVEDAVECVFQAGRGLQYAHQRGIVHRDIKPGNLLLNSEGVVKILDMGLARISPSRGESLHARADTLTSSGQVMGTCDYMAPEQAENLHGSDHRVDIYALGCTLYRLLTNRAPYAGDSFIQILLAHREAPLPKIRDVRPEVPEALDDAFQKMIAKKPDERFATMAEGLAALEQSVAGWEGAANLPALLGAGAADPALAATMARTSLDRAEPETIRRSRPESDTRDSPDDSASDGDEQRESSEGRGGILAAWGRSGRFRAAVLGVAALVILLIVVIAVSTRRSAPPPTADRSSPASEAGEAADEAASGESEEDDAGQAAPEPESLRAGETPADSEATADLAAAAKQETLAALTEHFRVTHLSLDTTATGSSNGASWTVSGHARNDADEVTDFVCRLSVTRWDDALRWKVVSIDLDGQRKWPPSSTTASSSPPRSGGASRPAAAPPSSSTAGQASPYSGPRSATPPTSPLRPPPPKPELVCEFDAELDFGEAQKLIPLPPPGQQLEAPVDRLLLEVAELQSFPSSARISWRNRVAVDQEIRVIVSDQLGAEIHVEFVRSGDGVAARISPILRGSDSSEGELTSRRILSLKNSYQDAREAAQRKLVSMRRQIVMYAQQKSAVEKALVAPEQLAQKNAQIRLLDQRIADAQQAEKKQADSVARLGQQGDKIDALAKFIRSLGNSSKLTLRLYRKVP